MKIFCKSLSICGLLMNEYFFQSLEAKRRARYLRFAYPPQEKDLKESRRQALKLKVVTILLR